MDTLLTTAVALSAPPLTKTAFFAILNTVYNALQINTFWRTRPVTPALPNFPIAILAILQLAFPVQKLPLIYKTASAKPVPINLASANNVLFLPVTFALLASLFKTKTVNHVLHFL
jgi:hypothetical protein